MSRLLALLCVDAKISIGNVARIGKHMHEGLREAVLSFFQQALKSREYY